MSKVIKGGAIIISFLMGCVFMNTIAMKPPTNKKPKSETALSDFSIIINYEKNNTNLLAKLCDKYGSDKGAIQKGDHPYPWEAHSYADFYAMLFEPYRLNVKKVFECGIGTNNPDLASSMGINGKPGASLRVWRDYFPNAQIIGADIDRDILFQENRIKTYYMDQTDPKSVAKFWSKVNLNNFDFMLDDGLHTYEAAISLFENSISRLAKNGVYIIEDVNQTDLPGYKDYFASKEYHVDYVKMLRPNLPLHNNIVVVIRKK